MAATAGRGREFHDCLASIIYKPDGSVPEPDNDLLKFRCQYRAMIASQAAAALVQSRKNSFGSKLRFDWKSNDEPEK